MQRQQQFGFTIVELLVVIVVIGILSVVATVAFNGIVDRSKITRVQADLAASAKLLSVYRYGSSSTESFPTKIDCTTTPVANSTCLKVSSGSTYRYNGAGKAFCLKITNDNVTFGVSADDPVPSIQNCNTGFVSTFVAAPALGGPIATDSAGNMYVSSQASITKVTPAGVVSTYAGNGIAGFNDGLAASAQFSTIAGLAFDSAGNLYVGDSGNHRIRKITPGGLVSTYAGSGTFGAIDGSAGTAQFRFPQGVVVDSANNLFVAGNHNMSIRKITPAGVVSTFAGDPGSASGSLDATGTAARFYFPVTLAIDSSNNLYVGEGQSGNRVRKVTSAGVVTTIAGSPDGNPGFQNGPGPSALFDGVAGIAVTPNGTLYVSDAFNHLIRKISNSGEVSTFSGVGLPDYLDGNADVARFKYPNGILVTAQGVLYVADSGNNRIRKLE